MNSPDQGGQFVVAGKRAVERGLAAFGFEHALQPFDFGDIGVAFGIERRRVRRLGQDRPHDVEHAGGLRGRAGERRREKSAHNQLLHRIRPPLLNGALVRTRG